jgi:hypothetical protein
VLTNHFQHKTFVIIGARQYTIASMRMGKMQGGVSVVEMHLDDKGYVPVVDDDD